MSEDSMKLDHILLDIDIDPNLGEEIEDIMLKIIEDKEKADEKSQ